MAASAQFVRGAIQSALDTGLNSLANNSLAISSLITPDLTAPLYVEVEAVFTYASDASAGALSVWFIREIDGTNYSDGGASTTPTNVPDLQFRPSSSTSAQRIIQSAGCPPGNFKILLKNDATGYAMAASGNTIKLRFYTVQQR